MANLMKRKNPIAIGSSANEVMASRKESHCLSIRYLNVYAVGVLILNSGI